MRAKIGDRLERGVQVGSVHARDAGAAAAAVAAAQAALTIGDEPASAPPLVHDWFG
jgi:thymidine phosphorylase